MARRAGKTSASRVLWTGFLVAIAGCVTPPAPPDGSKEEAAKRAKIRETIEVVALSPIRVGTPSLDPERVVEAFEERIATHLEDAGLKVIRPAVWDALWRRYAADVGPVFDASTGEVDDENYEVVRDAVYRALVEEHDADGMLWLAVRVEDSRGFRGHPAVCGQQSAPYWPAGAAQLDSQRAPPILARTACLIAVLDDPSGNDLFSRWAPFAGVETYDDQTRATRPRDEPLSETVEIERAIETVLSPFRAAEDGAPKAAATVEGEVPP